MWCYTTLILLLCLSRGCLLENDVPNNIDDVLSTLHNPELDRGQRDSSSSSSSCDNLTIQLTDVGQSVDQHAELCPDVGNLVIVADYFASQTSVQLELLFESIASLKIFGVGSRLRLHFPILHEVNGDVTVTCVADSQIGVYMEHVVLIEGNVLLGGELHTGEITTFNLGGAAVGLTSDPEGLTLLGQLKISPAQTGKVDVVRLERCVAILGEAGDTTGDAGSASTTSTAIVLSGAGHIGQVTVNRLNLPPISPLTISNGITVDMEAGSNLDSLLLESVSLIVGNVMFQMLGDGLQTITIRGVDGYKAAYIDGELSVVAADAKLFLEDIASIDKVTSLMLTTILRINFIWYQAPIPGIAPTECTHGFYAISGKCECFTGFTGDLCDTNAEADTSGFCISSTDASVAIDGAGYYSPVLTARDRPATSFEKIGKNGSVACKFEFQRDVENPGYRFWLLYGVNEPDTPKWMSTSSPSAMFPAPYRWTRIITKTARLYLPVSDVILNELPVKIFGDECQADELQTSTATSTATSTTTTSTTTAAATTPVTGDPDILWTRNGTTSPPKITKPEFHSTTSTTYTPTSTPVGGNGGGGKFSTESTSTATSATTSTEMIPKEDMDQTTVYVQWPPFTNEEDALHFSQDAFNSLYPLLTMAEADSIVMIKISGYDGNITGISFFHTNRGTGATIAQLIQKGRYIIKTNGILVAPTTFDATNDINKHFGGSDTSASPESDSKTATFESFVFRPPAVDVSVWTGGTTKGSEGSNNGDAFNPDSHEDKETSGSSREFLYYIIGALAVVLLVIGGLYTRKRRRMHGIARLEEPVTNPHPLVPTISADPFLDDKGFSELHYAVAKGDVASLVQLFESNNAFSPTPSETDAQVPSLSPGVAGGGDLVEMVEMSPPSAEVSLGTLLLDVTDKQGNTPLMWAVRMKHLPIIRMLLKRGADANKPNSHRQGPVHAACMDNVDIHIVRALLSARGINLNVQDEHMETPLTYVVRLGRADIVDELLKAGASSALSGPRGLTPLMLAVTMAQSEVVSRLLEDKHGLCNATDARKWTALHWAVAVNDCNLVRQLLAVKQVEIYAQNDNGLTPLHFAARDGDRECLELMLRPRQKRGSEQLLPLLLLKTLEGLTARDLAQKNGHADCVKVLSDAQNQHKSVMEAIASASSDSARSGWGASSTERSEPDSASDEIEKATKVKRKVVPVSGIKEDKRTKKREYLRKFRKQQKELEEKLKEDVRSLESEHTDLRTKLSEAQKEAAALRQLVAPQEFAISMDILQSQLDGAELEPATPSSIDNDEDPYLFGKMQHISLIHPY